ncbi:MAG: pyridoxine 5'-phosphate synthase [Cellvibrionaceae bacterium]|nr:pyridoxine 5'-phosphate synthase [Cellvibrionaceae bacterium]
MSIALSVNLNKIALIRNSRAGNYPDVVAHGRICLDAGAHGLTVHPRPDQRHIRASDVAPLSALVREYPGTEFNIEGNPFAPHSGSYPGLLALVESSRPHQCTLVPDTQQQLTSDHGFDLHADGGRLQPIIRQLQEWGVRVSLFMDPDLDQIRLARQLGADRIELYTGPFAEAYAHQAAELQDLYQRYVDAANLALELGLGINAGHDLNLENMTLFRSLPGLQEVSIGHALTVDALHMGLTATVKAYLALCEPVA